jgi:hypothetical protein
MVATTYGNRRDKEGDNTKLPAFKCHHEVDLSSSESNTDEERPTKVSRVEVTKMSDSNWLCMPCDPRCVSPDEHFDEEDKKRKLRLPSQGKCVPGLIPKKKIVDKPMPPLIPDFFQGISPSLIPKDKISRELYVGNVPPGTTEAVLIQFLNGEMRRVGLVGQSESAIVSCRTISRSRFAFIECGTWEYAGRALNLNGIPFLGASLRVSRPYKYAGPPTPSKTWQQLTGPLVGNCPRFALDERAAGKGIFSIAEDDEGPNWFTLDGYRAHPAIHTVPAA